jgi:hypothetical protein
MMLIQLVMIKYFLENSYLDRKGIDALKNHGDERRRRSTMTSINGSGLSANLRSDYLRGQTSVDALTDQWARCGAVDAPDDTRSRSGQVEVCRTHPRNKHLLCSELKQIAQFSRK